MKFARPSATAVLLAALMFSGCKTTDDKPETAQTAKTAKNKPLPTTLRDQGSDPAFQGFINRLRLAIKAHDADTVASMMTTDFGYRLNPVGEGDGVFKYWDENNIWPELQLVFNERFVPSGSIYMVAPPEFAVQGGEYTGYRAGIVLQNGSWKFAYFVSGQ